ncbi:uncharacterized protein LOC106883177, partial [Octopus bimaculoides]|uniref:uncharacterized protein LOC106883177 n=1 Tax=Octopus bimaculoides TaxID=37653 RepID=UPI00071C70FD
ICGLHDAYGCKHHEVLIFSTLVKDGGFEICYRNKLMLFKTELTCNYKDMKYKEGDTIVDGCKVCYCTEHKTMPCVTMCKGENEKAVMIPKRMSGVGPENICCAEFGHKVLCNPLKKEPVCKFQDQIIGEGIYFGKYGMFACLENGTATSLAIY